MYLSKRIESLENQLSPKMDYWISYTVGDKTQDEAIEDFCSNKRLDVEKFRNWEYGAVNFIERIIVSPGDKL